MANINLDQEELETIAESLEISPEDVLLAMKYLEKAKNRKPGTGGKKWSELTEEEKAKRLEYTKNYNAVKTSRLNRVGALAKKHGVSIEDFLTQLEA